MSISSYLSRRNEWYLLLPRRPFFQGQKGKLSERDGGGRRLITTQIISEVLKTLPRVPPSGEIGFFRASLIAQLVKNPPALQTTPVRFPGQEDPLEKG